MKILSLFKSNKKKFNTTNDENCYSRISLDNSQDKVNIQYNNEAIEYNENYNNSYKEYIKDINSDELLIDAIDLVMDMGQASTSMLQRRFNIGYSRAGRIIDQIEACGIISEYNGSKPRQVLISKECWEKIKGEFNPKTNEEIEKTNQNTSSNNVIDYFIEKDREMEFNNLNNTLITNSSSNLPYFIIDNLIKYTNPNTNKTIIISSDIFKISTKATTSHNLIPIVQDIYKSISVINWLMQEMINRYNLLLSQNVKSIKEYNQIASKGDALPHLLLLIDEYETIYETHKDEFKNLIFNILSRGLTVGIHVILCTKNNSKNLRISKIEHLVEILTENEFIEKFNN